MRYTLIIILVGLLFAACKKDKFTTVPQIKYKSIHPNTVYSNIPLNQQVIPTLTMHVTDSEGDLGFKSGSDTTYVYLKNLLTGKVDSLRFPDLQTAAGKDFEADVDVNLASVLNASLLPSPKIDTLYFEVYINDFAKNKSNVITTADPVYLISP